MRNPDYLIVGAVLNEAIDIQNAYGHKMLESVYQTLLANRLREAGFKVACEVPISITDHGLFVKDALRMDMVIEDMVVVELKVADANKPVFERQLLTYLRLANKPFGILLNFGMPTIKMGYKHFINPLYKHP